MGKRMLEKEKRARKELDKSGVAKKRRADEAGGRVAALEKAEQGEETVQEGGKKAPRKAAKKALRKAVKKAVNERSNQIAKSLVDHTAEGDIRSANVVITLIENQSKEGKDDKPWTGPSVAELLAAEPEWDEEMERQKGNEKEIEMTPLEE